MIVGNFFVSQDLLLKRRFLQQLGVVHILRNQFFGIFNPPPSVINRNQDPTHSPSDRNIT